jgi:hypothetical protein
MYRHQKSDNGNSGEAVVENRFECRQYAVRKIAGTAGKFREKLPKFALAN